MNSTIRTVEISGRRYQIRKLPADVGSFILMQLLNASANGAMKSIREIGISDREIEDIAAKPMTEEMKNLTAEQKTRGMVNRSLMGGLTRAEFKELRLDCFRVVQREEPKGGFLPIMTDDGRFASKEIESDIGDNNYLTLAVMMEVLVWNLKDFFEQGGMESMASITRQDGSL